MFIRKVTTSKAADGTRYETFRIVENERVAGGKTRQNTLITIGSRFDLDRSLWRPLCKRVEELIYGTPSFLPTPPEVEKYAQKFAQRILAKRAVSAEKAPWEDDPDRYMYVDTWETDVSHLRSVGAEHVCLHAVQEIQLPEILKDIGFTPSQVAMALAVIVGRMVKPGSENATWKWMTKKSAIGDLLEVDFSKKSVMRLHRISDELMLNWEKIEAALFDRIRALFSFEETILLYDLTNIHFEGEMTKNGKAKRGHAKNRRTDAPLMTLGLVLDSSGFVKRSQAFAGNVSEASTVKGMLKTLGALEESLVVMDRGTATKEIINWLVSENYRYVVVSREKERVFDMGRAQTIKTAGKQELKIYSELNKEKTEVKLYCYSPARAAKENGITERFSKKFEEDLRNLNEGLSRPRTEKKKDSILERIGRFKAQSRGVSQNYRITLTDNADTKDPDKPLLVTSVSFERIPVQGSISTHPGVYSIRTNALGFSDEEIWRVYAILTDLEAVFRSLKSELGLRPVYHQTEGRAEGHMLITVIAYQCVQVIRKKLKAHGIYDCWQTIREDMSTHHRTTNTLLQRNGATVHIRKASRPEARHQDIYNALSIDHRPGGTMRTRFHE